MELGHRTLAYVLLMHKVMGGKKGRTEKDLPDLNLFSLRQRAIEVELQLVLALLVLLVGL